MEIKRLSLDEGVFNDVIIRLLSLTRMVQDGDKYKPTMQMPNKDALETTLILILSGLANSGIYSRNHMLEISQGLVKYFNAPKGPTTKAGK